MGIDRVENRELLWILRPRGNWREMRVVVAMTPRRAGNAKGKLRLLKSVATGKRKCVVDIRTKTVVSVVEQVKVEKQRKWFAGFGLTVMRVF